MTMATAWDDAPPPYREEDTSPSAPTMAAVPTAAFCSPPTAANSMGLSAKLTQLQEAEAAGLLTAKELATARQRAIDGFVGHAEAGAPERGAAAAGAWGPTGAWAPAGGVAQPPLGVAPPATALPYQGLITTKDIEGCWICCCFPFCWWALFKKVATGPDTLNHVGCLFSPVLCPFDEPRTRVAGTNGFSKDGEPGNIDKYESDHCVCNGPSCSMKLC
mmetsp:Transcript_27376/g.63591  ORF Transcript_27376/g.63591 Transcript_27376/m.63591 type:complete len:218 (-) Transcript_27376:54-707(-)